MVIEGRSMRMVSKILVMAALVMIPAGWAGGEVFTFQNGAGGYGSCVDTTIAAGGWSQPPQSRIRVMIDYFSGDEVYNTLIRFDNISGILAGETIVSATLTLTFQREDTAWAPATLDIYPSLKDWTDPTWTHVAPGVEWDEAGAQGAGTDRGTLASSFYMGNRSFSQGIQYPDDGPFEITLPKSLIQSWIDDPASNKGLIIVMNPTAATDVTFSSSEDTTLDFRPMLTVETGAVVTVPDVVGMTQLNAVITLANAGLGIGEITDGYHDTIPAGSVMEQTPAADSEVSPGTPVALVISQGPAKVIVPGVVGLSHVDAVTALIGAQLQLGTVSYAHHPTIPIDHVIAQDPYAGAEVAKDTAVDLVESLGPVTKVSVPDVVGESHAAAVDAITTAGLVVGAIDYEFHPTILKDYVIAQDPCAGMMVDPCSPVDLTESLGPQPTPDFDGNLIVNLGDFAVMAGEWMNCFPKATTTDMTGDRCVGADDLALLLDEWLGYLCTDRPAADLNGDCCVGDADYDIMMSEWLTCDPGNIADIDGSGDGCVDMEDYAVLSIQWGTCGNPTNP